MISTNTLPKHKTHPGVLIAVTGILVWSSMLIANLSWGFSWSDPLSYLRILVQAHLFTWLFITAHDAMHGTVAPSKPKLNHLIGKICTLLFIFNSYRTLRPKHYLHHRHAGTKEDPDFHKGQEDFFSWYFVFLKEYITWRQLLLTTIAFNLAILWVPIDHLIAFWVVPSLLATFQLFYFGTYLPHRGLHDPGNRYNSRSQKKNHLFAFLTCYFFGYHYEHHESPSTPWWRLWRLKQDNEAVDFWTDPVLPDCDSVPGVGEAL